MSCAGNFEVGTMRVSLVVAVCLAVLWVSHHSRRVVSRAPTGPVLGQTQLRSSYWRSTSYRASSRTCEHTATSWTGEIIFRDVMGAALGNTFRFILIKWRKSRMLAGTNCTKDNVSGPILGMAKCEHMGEHFQLMSLLQCVAQ